MKLILLSVAIICAMSCALCAEDGDKADLIETACGDVEIRLVGHASLMFTFDGMTIYVDPWSTVADYGVLPKADIVLLTHDHGDHLDQLALESVCTTNTSLVVSPACSGKVDRATVLANGEETTVRGVGIEAVPAYNLVSKRPNGQPFHPKGPGNGYVLTFGDKRVYVAGDTENTPEMKALKEIDVAFLPMNQPYTMTSEMGADTARSFMPKILYPYHCGETDLSQLQKLLEDYPGIVIRIRPSAKSDR